MRNVYKFLRASILILILVGGTYFIAQEYSAGIENAVNTSAGGQSLTKETITNLGDVLATVEAEIAGGAGSEKTNDTVKSDYQPVQGTGQLVEDSKSQQTDTTPAASYDFPENMYPYRAMLSDTQKEVYDQVYGAALELKESVTLCRQLDQSSIKNVMNAVFNDHPELFWPDTGYSYGYTSKGAVISVMLKYNETAQTLQSARQKFLNAAAKVINGASSLTTDLDQSAYSVFINGSSVCAGYSRAFQYIMQQLNIPCYFCTGYANGGYHAWNIVYIDGKYYNVDLSWDDSLGDVSNTYSFAYFNLSDKAISVDHTRRELSVNLPECK